MIKKCFHLILIIVFGSTAYISSQTQIGDDIEGLLSGDRFGRNVSLSSDGNIIAITSGVVASSSGGRIRVFKNIGGVWTLYGTDINGENFGGIGSISISISADGNTLASAGWGDVVRVFSYDINSGVWTPKGSDIPNNTSASSFGYSIKLSSDGNTLAIGSTSAPIVPEAGTTQVFQFEEGMWNQVGNDIVGLLPTEHSGRSIDMSSEGNILAISNDESVKVYHNISDTWTLLGTEIIAAGSQSTNRRISLSSDGSILAIGEPDFTDTLIQSGRVRVFKYELGIWNQVGSSIVGEIAYYRTGWSVSLSANGQILAIGELGSTSGSTDTGRARIFENQNNAWIQIGNEIFGEWSEDYASNASLSSDGTTLALGSEYNDGNGIDSGHARVFSIMSLLSVNDMPQSNISIYPNPAKESITIQLPDDIELEKIDIYDNWGRLITSSNKNHINTSKFTAGTYYVEVLSNQGKMIKKIIVN
ncbi:T9SS type A sorting domain-containing protein [Winogradskyella sp. A2]|uniref:T9SS type A sorting domain-containing protein n=1 Tax=Winogradskyella sp. A2 TaxID=3366944 RepID=UPI00398C7B42